MTQQRRGCVATGCRVVLGGGWVCVGHGVVTKRGNGEQH